MPMLQGSLSAGMLSGSGREVFWHQEYFSYPLTGAVGTPTPLVLTLLEMWLGEKKKHRSWHLVSDSECPNIGSVSGEADRFLWFL